MQPLVFQNRATEWTRLYANPNDPKTGTSARIAAKEQPIPISAGPSGAANGEGLQGPLDNQEPEMQRSGSAARQAERAVCEVEVTRGPNPTQQKPSVEEGRMGMSEVPAVREQSSPANIDCAASSSGQMQPITTGADMPSAGGGALVPPRSRLALGKRSRT
ncbi:hypothetical protein Vretimale_7987 [Volvox reticuliferus]|nr:hypothetical protein Vretifemale_5118 [Volvox reticuliferus]GIM03173.1 hypothetical protein Vretimale_7987 [Volvox reticuliferus]